MKHILMVDDSTTNLKMAASVLSPYYELAMAKSGKQALAFLKKNKPDLILLDLLMPEMDGYQTMEEIKLNPATANIPIIFLTADKQRESEIKGLQLGALDFITKPFEEDVMLSRIEKVLMMDEMRRGLFEEEKKDATTGLFLSEYVRKKSIKNVDSDKGGAIILIAIQNYVDLRTQLDSKTYTSYMDYIHGYLAGNGLPEGMACQEKDNEYMYVTSEQLDELELSKLMSDIHDYLSKDIINADGKKITVDIKLAGAFMLGEGDFEDYYKKAEMAFYHVRNTDFLNYHIYRSL